MPFWKEPQSGTPEALGNGAGFSTKEQRAETTNGVEMEREPKPVPAYLLILCSILFCSGYFVLRFPNVPGADIVSYVFNAIIALPAFLGLRRQLGSARTAVALIAVSVFAYLIEGYGTVSGVPYGNFHYGDALGPRVFGVVPYLLPLSYVPLVIGAVGMFAGPKGWLRTVLPATLFLVLVDGVLDPGAAVLGFWTWPDGGFYYGVPLSNYGGWLLSGLIAVALLTWIGGSALQSSSVRPELLDSLIASLAFWCGVTVFAGLVVPAVLAAVLLLFVVRRRIHLVSFRNTEQSSPAAGWSHRTQ